MNIIALQIDTTGLDHYDDQILSFTASVKKYIEGEKEGEGEFEAVDSKTMRLRPRGDVVANAGRVRSSKHDPYYITATAIYENEAALEIYNFFSKYRGHIIIGSNILKALEFTKDLCLRYGYDIAKFIFKDKVIDTASSTRSFIYSHVMDVKPLSLGSMAKALGVKVPDSLGAKERIGLDFELWRATGAVDISLRLSANVPERLTSLEGGKVVSLTRYFSHLDAFSEKRYYVSSFLLKDQSAMIIDLEKYNAEGKDADHLSKTAILNMAKKFNEFSDEILAISDIHESHYDMKDLEKISIYAKEIYEAEMNEKVKDRLLNIISMKKLTSRYKVPEDMIVSELSSDLRKKGYHYAMLYRDMTRDEIIDRIKDEAKTLDQLVFFLHAIEEAGYRSGIKKYDTARREVMRFKIPPKMTPITKLTTIDNIDDKSLKAIFANECLEAIKISNDSRGVEIELYYGDDRGLLKSLIKNGFDKGKDTPVSVVSIGDELKRIIPSLTSSQIMMIREGLKPKIDNVSYEYIKNKFIIELADAEKKRFLAEMKTLRTTLMSLGANYDEFLKNTATYLDKEEDKNELHHTTPQLANSETKKEESLSTSSKEASKKEEISEGRKDDVKKFRNYSDMNGISLSKPIEEMDNVERAMAIITYNPNDIIMLDKAKAAFHKTKKTTAKEEEIKGTSEFCKVCGKNLSTSASLHGMGIKCAAKLSGWVKEQIKNKNLGMGDAEVIDTLNNICKDGKFPIVVVRNPADGDTAVLDIQSKGEDGKYLILDLGEMTSKEKGSSLDRAIQVFLDDKQLEVLNVFGAH